MSGQQSILGNLDQTLGGQDLYASVEEKGVHLLYFVIKDHPFSDETSESAPVDRKSWQVRTSMW